MTPRPILAIVLGLLAIPASPTTLSIEFFYQPDTIDPQVAGDRFGQTVTSGDFDGDGLADFVLGAPFKTLDGVISAGVVVVSYADFSEQTLRPDAGFAGSDQGGNYGFALAAIDLTDDGFDELIVGAPGTTVEGIATGAIDIWSGGPEGLSYSGRRFPPDYLEQIGARFGAALAADDNVVFVGAPEARVDGVASGGVYTAVIGPLGFCVQSRIDQDSPNVAGTAEAGDAWGSSLDAIRTTSTTFRIAIGAPREDIGAIVDAGATWDNVWRVDETCDVGARPEVVLGGFSHQGDGFVGDTAETGDLYGSVVHYGRFGPGIARMMVGTPREDRESDSLGDTGCVQIFNGPESERQCQFADDLGLDAATPGQLTGSAIEVADYDLDGYGEMIVGIPGADFTFGRAGAIAVVNDTSAGLVPQQVISLGVLGNSFGAFGTSVAFTVGPRKLGRTELDLLIGHPGYDAGSVDRAGRGTRVAIIGSMIFGDGFETGDLSAWEP